MSFCSSPTFWYSSTANQIKYSRKQMKLLVNIFIFHQEYEGNKGKCSLREYVSNDFN